MFQMLEQEQKNQSNPMDMLKQVTKGYTPEQMNSLLDKAKQFGVSEKDIEKVQKQIEEK